MSDDLLAQIQALQFTDKPAAEALLKGFIQDTLKLIPVKVELRPLAVSLNSFNGFVTLDDGRRLFFKTHTEPGSVIGEYYQGAVLAKAGYPISQPLFSSTKHGQQLLVYDVIYDPSVFDTAWALELETEDSDTLAALTNAQNAADDQLLNLYLQTLEWQSANEAAKAAVHQLFFHRLAAGRLERFYGPDLEAPAKEFNIKLPDGEVAMSDVRAVRWQINGQRYDITLDEIIEKSIDLLDPIQDGPSIIGHGDAHNGNIFFRGSAPMLYFDPAFAGCHHPLLDLTKPLFHNVFAMWMYFPRIKKQEMTISLRKTDERWMVEHDYVLHPVREMFLKSKVDRVLVPILRELKRRTWLRSDWRQYLKASLFCCPLLTMNLTDHEKYPPEISLLGLTMAVEMGADSEDKRSRIDTVLDEVEKAL
ncbi:MAG: hypothetical protein H7175_01575 [Burkholderiales bacterium]|nr:hypothetical protein [Anaerolineae bacterium]